MPTDESLRATIGSERALLLALKEKVASPYLKNQCQMALHYVDDCEYFFFGGGLDNPTEYLYHAHVMLQLAENLRRFVEDCVGKWGYDAVAVPYDLKWS